MNGHHNKPDSRSGDRSDRWSDRVVDEPRPDTEFAGLYAMSAPESSTPQVAGGSAGRSPSRTPRQRLDRINQNLTARDRAVLADVGRYGFLTTKQIQLLHFHNHRTPLAAARLTQRLLARLADLAVLEHLDRRIGGLRAGSASFVWRVGRVGDRVLRADSDRPRARRKEPSLRHLDHRLTIASSAIALIVAARAGSFELVEVAPEPLSWRRYLSHGPTPDILKPDLYAVTASGDYEDHWFIEIDRATESRPTVLKKCAQYERYRRSGQEQRDDGVFPLIIWLVPTRAHADWLTAAIRQDRSLDDALYRVTTLDRLTQLIAGGST